MIAGHDGSSGGVPHNFFFQTLWVRILELATFCDVFTFSVFFHLEPALL
jgi:hypothetical protein